jgi:predicted transcriptional regulator
MEYIQEVFDDNEISLKAKGLMLVVLSNSLEDDFTVSWFSTKVKEGKHSIQSAINELIEHGYCQRGPVWDWQGKYAGYKYKFSKTKIQS